MGGIQSKVTAQGQISVPAEVRRQLGVGPGSVLVWEWRGVRGSPCRKCTSADIHAAVFGSMKHAGAERTDVKAGIRKYIRRRHARG